MYSKRFHFQMCLFHENNYTDWSNFYLNFERSICYSEARDEKMSVCYQLDIPR